MPTDKTWAALQRRGRRALLGKHKPTFTPGVEMGDYVVVVNAEHVTATGTKTSLKMDSKMYHHHSGYPGGLKSVSMREQLRIHPDRVLREAVWGMLPHNKMGHSLMKRLKIYAGPNYPHGLQKPEVLK